MAVFMHDECPVIVTDDNFEEFTDRGSLGRGASRTAYLLPGGRFVMKIVTGDSSYGDNMSEWRAWEEWKGTDDGRFLCPIYAIGDKGRWLVMRKADNVDDYYYGSTTAMRRAARHMGISDLHSQNVGTLDDEPVIIDYAYNPHPRADGASGYSQSSGPSPVSSCCECGSCNCSECGEGMADICTNHGCDVHHRAKECSATTCRVEQAGWCDGCDANVERWHMGKRNPAHIDALALDYADAFGDAVEVIVCGECAPRLHRVECSGQGALWPRGLTDGAPFQACQLPSLPAT